MPALASPAPAVPQSQSDRKELEQKLRHSAAPGGLLHRHHSGGMAAAAAAAAAVAAASAYAMPYAHPMYAHMFQVSVRGQLWGRFGLPRCSALQPAACPAAC